MKIIGQSDFDAAGFRDRPLWTGRQFRRAERIVQDVRTAGLAGLLEWSRRLDGAAPEKLVLKTRDLERLSDGADKAGCKAVDRAAASIARFARAQKKSLSEVKLSPAPGVTTEARIEALDSAGGYVPGGRYPLISTALMNLIPAREAGVGRIAAATPPNEKGRLSGIMAYALLKAGAAEVLLAGGAQAVAAMAFGVKGFGAVDKIVGPGNVYVTAAKYIVSSHVGVDMLAGPSEICIVADSAAEAELIAWDLLAQAEHDVLATPLLFTSSRRLAARVNAEIESNLRDLRTADVARQSLKRGAIVVFRSLEAALSAADRLAPEHLELHVSAAATRARDQRHFGSLFAGGAAAEVLGDYSAGINHTLPTQGAARYRGGLSVLDFLKVQTVLTAKPGPGSDRLAGLAAQLAELEGLPAHATAARKRIRGKR